MTLFIFDKDGTLVGGLNNRPANTPDEQKPLSNVVEKIAELRNAGHKIAIASNQGGVAWGFISMEQADDLLSDCAEKIGGADAYEFCPHDDKKLIFCECRKPRPGMLLRIMQRLDIDPIDTIMVGDQRSDKQSAEAAGVGFICASEFFGW